MADDRGGPDLVQCVQRYLCRCTIAGDRRPIDQLLRDILSENDVRRVLVRLASEGTR